MPNTKPVPSPANFQEVEKIFIRYYTAMMADDMSIADGCKQAARRAQRLLRAAEGASQNGRLRPDTGGGRGSATRRRDSKIDSHVRRHHARTSELAALQARTGYLFVVPTFALYLTFVLAPVVLTVVLSFAYYDPQLGSHWVGLDNYHRFFTDPRSLRIFWNTLPSRSSPSPATSASGSCWRWRSTAPCRGWLLYFFRLAFFLPVIIAAAFVSIVWSYFYSDSGHLQLLPHAISACRPCAG